MASTGKNNSRYGRFWVLMKGREHMIDKDEIVMQFTDGRTTHLSEMTRDEYNEMCAALEGRFNRAAYEQQLKKARSAVLYRVGKLGINTIDNWDEINAFLLSPKIAGKVLYEMSLEEMKELFERADFVKFAKFTASDDDNAKVLPIAVRFVTSTYQTELELEQEVSSIHVEGQGDNDNNDVERR